MNSSHSATPTFSPLLEVVVVEDVVFVVVFVVALLALPVFEVELSEDVFEPPHAAKRSAKDTHSIRGIKVLFNNWILLESGPARDGQS